MKQNSVKGRVTIIRVSKKDHYSIHPIKHQREMSVRVTKVSRNSLTSRPETGRSETDNDNKSINEQQRLSKDSNLKKMKTTPMPFDQYELRTISHNPIHPSILKMNKISSINKSETEYPRKILSNSSICQPTLTTSSLNKSFGSFDNYDTSINLFKSKSILEYHGKQSKRKFWRDKFPIFEINSKKPAYNFDENVKKKRKKRYRFCKLCSFCSYCCCFASTIGIFLFLAGLAALLFFIITNQQHITTITTSTTSTTSETTTSSTSTTSTTATTSTSSDTTTTTTPAPPCTPTSVGNASTLYSALINTAMSYTCFAYAWTSPTTGLVTLAFQLRNDPGIWYLDDVSVYSGATQMLSNGGFESGSLSPWVRTTPNGGCVGSPGQVGTASPHSGTHALNDGSNGCQDEISQQFTAIAGQTYVVSFWLKSLIAGTVQSANVTLF